MKPIEKEYELFIGPNHPGATGNMSYHIWVEGDKVKKAETRVGYLHRGFEKLMEKRLWMQNVPLVCRICVPEPDVNEASYSMAVEDLMGWEIPERAKYIRTIILEMARLGSHLMTVGGIAASLGIYTAAQWGIGDRDYLLDVFEQITGARVYHIYIWPGGVRWDIPKNTKELLTKVLDYLEKRMPLYEDLIIKNKVFIRRAADVGVIPKDKAIEWGVTGPNLRAAGYQYDFRKLEPYAAYDKIDFEVPYYPKLGEYEVLSDGSDIYTRTAIRMLEMQQSINIIRQALNDMPEGDVLVKENDSKKWFAWKVPAGYSYVRVESSKGEFGYFVTSDGGKKPVRVHVRGPSYTHGINVMETIAMGLNVADFAPTAISLDVCPPDIER